MQGSSDSRVLGMVAVVGGGVVGARRSVIRARRGVIRLEANIQLVHCADDVGDRCGTT